MSKPAAKKSKTEGATVAPAATPSSSTDVNRIAELEKALAASEVKVAAFEKAQAKAEAKAAELDCCADGACGLGQKVESVTEWCGGNKFNSKVGPEGHVLLLETGGGGEHIAPMQAVLGSASTCAAVGMLTKLQEKCTVDKLAKGMRAPMPGIPQSVFRTISLKYVVTSADASEDYVQECVKEHGCSVMANLGGVTKASQSAELLRP
eukprot:gene17246-16221_t